MTDLFSVHRELTRTFRFYIALTVFANLAYTLVLGIFIVAALALPYDAAFTVLLAPAMVSTGFAALSGFGVAEALSLHRAIQQTGGELRLPHVTRSRMLVVQTSLTLIFHSLLAFGLFAFVFFAALARFGPPL